MSEYGYIPEAPEQSFGNNKGIFTPKDIYDLTRADKYTNYGQLELIETQTISSATADFTALQETTYNVHLFTISDVHIGSQTELGYRLSNDGGTSYETGYQFGNTRLVADGGHASRQSTSQDSARLCGDIDAGAHSLANGILYLYNAGDSTKYTFSSSQMVFQDFQDLGAIEYGGQIYNHGEQMSAIRFGAGTGVTALTSATISLYGIKEYL